MPSTGNRSSTGSIRRDGLLASPYYFSDSQGIWLAATADQLPIDVIIGTGSGGDAWSSFNGNYPVSLREWLTDPAAVDYSGFRAMQPDCYQDAGSCVPPRGDVSVGYGTIRSRRILPINGVPMLVSQAFTLGRDTAFVDVTMNITNIGGAIAENLHVWVGVANDTLGSAGSLAKLRGNVIGETLVPAERENGVAVRANCMQVLSDTDTAFLFAPSGASLSSDAVYSSSFAAEPPVWLPRLVPWYLGNASDGPDDGGYGLVLQPQAPDLSPGARDLAPGATASLRWFFGAGPLSAAADILGGMYAAAMDLPPRLPSASPTASATPSMTPSATATPSATQTATAAASAVRCTLDAECPAGFCSIAASDRFGVCTSRRDPGLRCEVDAHCATRVCRNGTCCTSDDTLYNNAYCAACAPGSGRCVACTRGAQYRGTGAGYGIDNNNRCACVYSVYWWSGGGDVCSLATGSFVPQPPGGECGTAAGCSSGVCKNNRCCASNATDNCGACDPFGRCVICSSGFTFINGTCRSKLGVGETCATDSQCIDDICWDGVCSAKRAAGEACGKGGDCANGACRNGTCCSDDVAMRDGYCAACAPVTGNCTACTPETRYRGSGYMYGQSNLCSCMYSIYYYGGGGDTCSFEAQAVSPQLPGSECGTDAGCIAGLCRNNRCCANNVTENCGACDSSGRCVGCASGYFLDGSICRAKLSIGEACAASSQCLDEICSAGLCAAKRVAGESCSSLSDCKTGACRNGTCCSLDVASADGYCGACEVGTGRCVGCAGDSLYSQSSWSGRCMCNPSHYWGYGSLNLCNFETQAAITQPTGSMCGTDAGCTSGRCLASRCCSTTAAATPFCTSCDSGGNCSACSFGYFVGNGTCQLKLPSGNACETDGQCRSDSCWNGVCTTLKRPAGAACAQDTQCAGNVCRGGSCCAALDDTGCSFCRAGDGVCTSCQYPWQPRVRYAGEPWCKCMGDLYPSGNDEICHDAITTATASPSPAAFPSPSVSATPVSGAGQPQPQQQPGQCDSLIVNGGFEQPLVDPFMDWQNYFGGNVIAARDAGERGWFVMYGCDVEVVRAYWQPAEGFQSVDLDGSSACGIQQTLYGLVPGSQYVLSWQQAGNFEGPFNPGLQTLAVQLNGAEIMRSSVARTASWTRSNLGWERRSVTIQANGTSIVVGFRSLNPPYSGTGPVIDDVALKLVSGGSAPQAACSSNPTPSASPVPLLSLVAPVAEQVLTAGSTVQFRWGFRGTCYAQGYIRVVFVASGAASGSIPGVLRASPRYEPCSFGGELVVPAALRAGRYGLRVLSGGSSDEAPQQASDLVSVVVVDGPGQGSASPQPQPVCPAFPDGAALAALPRVPRLPGAVAALPVRIAGLSYSAAVGSAAALSAALQADAAASPALQAFSLSINGVGVDWSRSGAASLRCEDLDSVLGLAFTFVPPPASAALSAAAGGFSSGSALHDARASASAGMSALAAALSSGGAAALPHFTAACAAAAGGASTSVLADVTTACRSLGSNATSVCTAWVSA